METGTETQIGIRDGKILIVGNEKELIDRDFGNSLCTLVRDSENKRIIEKTYDKCDGGWKYFCESSIFPGRQRYDESLDKLEKARM
ncbi:MAG: hypothetical protein PHH54_06195 [Candidatus Nanoarchaeia archaeon]|nr:hypothetical protein [Candidatus Nanoarchaeia archaeon]MDD5741545.1 hypothetical protein [Candidatus Nanoarchaeia archaeon]